MTYKLNHNEYTSIVRRCAEISNHTESEAVKDLVFELLDVKYDYMNCYFELSEDLMQRVAIANLCNMALVHYNDSNGDIDYTGLDEYNKPVLTHIMHGMI